MVGNVWNDPEEDMERAAIDHYLDDITASGLLRECASLINQERIDSLNESMLKELRQRYDVDINDLDVNYEDNLDYLTSGLLERLEENDIHLGKSVWKTQS